MDLPTMYVLKDKQFLKHIYGIGNAKLTCLEPGTINGVVKVAGVEGESVSPQLREDGYTV